MKDHNPNREETSTRIGEAAPARFLTRALDNHAADRVPRAEGTDDSGRPGTRVLAVNRAGFTGAFLFKTCATLSQRFFLRENARIDAHALAYAGSRMFRPCISRPSVAFIRANGWVAERLKAPVLKTGRRLRVSWVRIPPHPPSALAKAFSRFGRGPVFPLFSRVMRIGLNTGPGARRPASPSMALITAILLNTGPGARRPASDLSGPVDRVIG